MGQAKSQKKLKFTAIFSPFRLGPFQPKNRIVALPVFTGYAYPDGRVSPQLIDHYTKQAQSGVAMVVVANAAISSDGITSTYNVRVDRDEYIPGLARLAKAIRKHGVIACLQLNHAGRFAKTEQPLLPSPIDSFNLAFNIEALKDFMNFFPLESRFKLTRQFLKQAHRWRQSMTAEDRERIIVNFGEAAVRAYYAGFDMIELHGANGYLICEFLPPFSNKIQYGFGESFQERTTFPLNVSHQSKIHVPVDLSMKTLLLLMFLRQSYIGKTGITLKFLHVLAGQKEPSQKLWQELIKIADMDGELQLKHITANGSVKGDVVVIYFEPLITQQMKASGLLVLLGRV